jgi:protein phosphatase
MKCLGADPTDYYALSEKGKRNRNEDHFIAKKIDDFYVFGIADGVGGLLNGELASKIAIDELTEEIKRKGEIGLQEGFEKANDSILFENKRRQHMMATTLLACIVKEDAGESIIAHVGDSRAYVINTDIWKTRDHTLVQDLVEMGIVTEMGAVAHPERHRINRALGIKENIEIDVHKKLVKDSILLLCSDGLSGYVSDNEIVTLAKQYGPKNACEKLVQIALDNGGQDNITVIIANISEGCSPDILKME